MVATEPLLGLDVASTSIAFLVFLGFHVAAALLAIAAGLTAMFSRKGPGRHPRSGRWYLLGVIVVFVTAVALSTFRWPTDAPLVALGALSVLAAGYGWLFRRLRRPGDAPHILAMSVSFTAMLTAFYVDNGPHLPVWNLLPHWTFWVLPTIFFRKVGSALGTAVFGTLRLTENFTKAFTKAGASSSNPARATSISILRCSTYFPEAIHTCVRSLAPAFW